MKLGKKFLYSVIGLTLLLAWSKPAAALNEALRNLDSISVVVKPLDPDAKRAHLDEGKLRQMIVDQIAKGGPDVRDGVGEPTLEITVTLIRNFGTRTASYRMVLRDWVFSKRDPKTRFLATVWERSGLVSASNWKLEERLGTSLKDLAAVFVHEYMEANQARVGREDDHETP